MLLLDCDEIEYFINGILARPGLKISPKNSKTFNPSIISTWTKAKYLLFFPSKGEKRIDHTSYVEKEVWFLTSVIFLSLLHFSRLSSRMAGKQGRMQSLPFKLRFPVHEERRADRSIAMLRPSRMDRNDNDTLGEFRVQLGNTRLFCWQTFVSLVDESYSNVEFLLRIKDKKIKGINLTLVMYGVIGFIVSQIYFLFFHFLFEIFHFHKDGINTADGY